VVTELPHLNWPRVVATVPLEKDAMEGPFPLEDLALEDATGNNVGTVSAEIPVGPKWCEIRQTVFGWTTQKFPFGVKTAHALKIREPHVITVTGKAFYDIGHAPADHSNRRSTPKGYAVWEIHPVMKMEVIP
jgi:hypothetical protein